MSNVVKINSMNKKKKYESLDEIMKEVTAYLNTTTLSETEKYNIVDYLNQFVWVVSESLTASLVESLKKDGLNLSAKAVKNE